MRQKKEERSQENDSESQPPCHVYENQNCVSCRWKGNILCKYIYSFQWYVHRNNCM